VWTYLTSLAFHWGTQNDRGFQPLIFPEGHPVQVEMAAIPENCHACALGEKLLRTLLEPASQELLMKRNFMMPVVRGIEAGTIFAELPRVKVDVPKTAADLSAWNAVFAR
jgi:thiamine transport system substrate-binding protein